MSACVRLLDTPWTNKESYGLKSWSSVLIPVKQQLTDLSELWHRVASPRPLPALLESVICLEDIHQQEEYTCTHISPKQSISNVLFCQHCIPAYTRHKRLGVFTKPVEYFVSWQSGRLADGWEKRRVKKCFKTNNSSNSLYVKD